MDFTENLKKQRNTVLLRVASYVVRPNQHNFLFIKKIFYENKNFINTTIQQQISTFCHHNVEKYF